MKSGTSSNPLSWSFAAREINDGGTQPYPGVARLAGESCGWAALLAGESCGFACGVARPYRAALLAGESCGFACGVARPYRAALLDIETHCAHQFQCVALGYDSGVDVVVERDHAIFEVILEMHVFGVR